jgi:hypothetical protein
MPAPLEVAVPVVVDHLILGAGIAGLVLRRMLGSGLVIDANPSGYKIGESVIPEQFQHPVMRSLLPAIEKLPSYSAKRGTIFIGDGAIASFPLIAQFGALHVFRSELEALMQETWQIPIQQERILEIDVKNHTVRTDRETYRSRGPILDCSGPAMLTATALGEVDTMWPISATWGYFDIEAVDDARFWHQVAQTGIPTTFLDVPSGRFLPHWTPETIKVSETTVLMQVAPGTWMWQIPLWHRKILSVGLVTRGQAISHEQFYDVAEPLIASCYKVDRRPPGQSPLDRVHGRSAFARRARRAASEDFVLIGDAYAFADPVYSVGTGLACTKALAVADALVRGPWTPILAEQYDRDYEQLFDRAIEAFQFWYDGKVMHDDATAVTVQRDFLAGRAFQDGAFRALSTAVLTAIDAVDGWIGHTAGSLLAPDLPQGWTPGRIEPTTTRDSINIHWLHEQRSGVTTQVALDLPGRPRFRTVGGVTLSYLGPANEGLEDLLDGLTRHLETRGGEWLALLQAVREHGSRSL